MNKLAVSLSLTLCFLLLAFRQSSGQAMHFSQYYNAPLLLNPANTGLIDDADFRLGAQHRMQWAALPAPFTTSSVYGDFQVLRNRYSSNWLGIGFAFFNDNVGDGKLNLFRSELFLAYHISIGRYNMISAGVSSSANSRSVNFSKFTFPVQWDGYTFDKNEPSQENKGLEKSHYNAIGAGLNYAFFPNDAIYLKVGYGLKNINTPTETFFKGGENTLDFRHTGSIDLLLKTGENVMINPSAYYSTQSGARELLYGSLVIFNMEKPTYQYASNQFTLGAFHRWGDALVVVAGIQRNGINLTASYDYTISKLPTIAGQATGAFELSLKYQGLYSESSRVRSLYHCPRF